MSGFGLSSVFAFEVNLNFATYSFQFGSYQSATLSKPITQLYFQRFSPLSDYPCIQYINLLERFCTQLEIPNLFVQTDYQKHFFTALCQKTQNSLMVAEAVDEDTEFMYLIIDQNQNPTVPRYFTGCTLEIFQFKHSELFNSTPNLEVYLKNLQLANIFLFQQYVESCNCYEFFKVSVNIWQSQAVNKDLKLDKKIEEVQKRTEVKKKVQKVLIREELPELDCLLCASNPKSVVFLPCGHVVSCKVCATENMKITLDKVINQRRSPRTCPVCMQAIKEAREVFID